MGFGKSVATAAALSLACAPMAVTPSFAASIGEKQAQKQAKQEAKQATAALDTQTKATFNKAWGACLEGRGYSVK